MSNSNVVTMIATTQTNEQSMLDKAAGMTAVALLKSLDATAKLGSAWLRVMVASEMGLEPNQATASWANSLTFETLTEHLEIVARRLCAAAVSRESMGHQTGFASLQTHLRNAFGAISGATVRHKADSTKQLGPTAAYAGSPFVSDYRVFSVDDKGNQHMTVAAIGWKAATPKADILDKTKEVADVLDAGAMQFQAETETKNETRTLGRETGPSPRDGGLTPEGVRLALHAELNKLSGDERIAYFVKRAMKRAELDTRRAFRRGFTMGRRYGK